MSWKKIIALALLLAALVIAIVFVDRSQKDKATAEGTLLDIPAAAVDSIELRSQGKRFTFSRRDTLWYLDEPLSTKADKVTLESILDTFCQLKYDRLVAENAAQLKDFGLDQPEIELKLVGKDRAKLPRVILLGMKNSLDGSSYAKLAGDGRVVTIAAYKRNDLEKDLFGFRDKKFLELDTAAVSAVEYRHEANAFALSKVGGQWFLQRPVYSLAQEAKLSDMLSSASLLEALQFAGAAAAENRHEFGLDKPLFSAEFRSVAGSRRIEVGKKGEQFFALVDGAAEICEIAKDFLDKFPSDAAALREKKIALFYAFDVRELDFQRGPLHFTVRKDASGTWEFDKPVAGKRPSEEKVSRLLTSLADCTAEEFVDSPSPSTEFSIRARMKVEEPDETGKVKEIAMEFSKEDGESLIARNPSLPYQFRVGKEIVEKMPTKIDDVTEEIAKTPGSGG